MPGLLDRIKAAVRNRRNRVKDPRPRKEFYDGTEKPSLDDPSRYARGARPVPPPPPTWM